MLKKLRYWRSMASLIIIISLGIGGRPKVLTPKRSVASHASSLSLLQTFCMYQGKFKNKKSDIFIIAILRCLRSHVLTKEYTSHTFSVIIYTFLPRCDSISSTSLDGFQSCFKPRWILPLNIHQILSLFILYLVFG